MKGSDKKMRAVLQRVKHAKVTVDKETVGEIENGMLVLLAVEKEDSIEDAKYLSEKILNLRIFNDSNHKMNLSLLDIEGQMLVVSQFTLYGDCKKGRRPSYDVSAPPDMANELYEKFVSLCKENNLNIQTGTFKAHMDVELLNDGPVTLLLDSKKNF